MTANEISPKNYEQQLQEKLQQLRSDFSEFTLPEPSVYRSPTSHYRMRAEFKIWHSGNRADYAMYKPGEYKKPYIITDFPAGSQLINQLMPPLLQAINADEQLRRKLFQVEFLTTLSGEALITMIYHKTLGDDWLASARTLRSALGADIIGRSRRQKCVLDRDFVIEELIVGGRVFRYQQIEASFTQPNAAICMDMLNWAVAQSQGMGGDLLELYCGNGNFTLPLAQNFQRVLATELAKSSVNSARYNMALNNIDNIAIARMSSEEFSQALDKVRAFKRLQDIDLDSYNFGTIFVDPPRAGLDPHTTSVAQRFENIIYISCNPDTLRDNLRQITQSHSIEAFAVFDQFPYTHHLECGAILKRRT